MAEKAIETGSPQGLVKLLTDTVEAQTRGRFDHVMHPKREASVEQGVKEMREYVETMLGFEVYSHKL